MVLGTRIRTVEPSSPVTSLQVGFRLGLRLGFRLSGRTRKTTLGRSCVQGSTERVYRLCARMGCREEGMFSSPDRGLALERMAEYSLWKPNLFLPSPTASSLSVPPSISNWTDPTRPFRKRQPRSLRENRTNDLLPHPKWEATSCPKPNPTPRGQSPRISNPRRVVVVPRVPQRHQRRKDWIVVPHQRIKVPGPIRRVLRANPLRRPSYD